MLAVLLATVVGVGLGTVSPARAEATLEVDAGYAGGNYLPGKGLPVRVRVAADRLIRGTLQVGLSGAGSEDAPVSVPVEVSGGSSKEFVVVVPTSVGQNRADVVAQLGDLTGETAVSYTGDTELVGLFPDVVGQAPAPTPLVAALGTARFSQLDDIELVTPGALDPLGTIVAGPEGLGGLDDASRGNVLTWIDQGGRLVVDTDPGESIDGVPDAWQPGEATRAAAGRGEIRFSAGAAAEERWDEVIEPTPLVAPGDLSQAGFWASESVADAVGRDGGLRIPTVGWLLGFLIIYVVVVGPVTSLVLWRVGRANWAWLLVPGLAVIFAAGAFTVGNDLRSGSQAAHGTVVHTGPGGSRAVSYVGLVSRNGADGRAEFPAGWSASGLVSALGAELAFPDDPFGGGTAISPADVSVQDGATVGEVALDPGGFGMVTGWGALDRTDGLEVTAVANADGSVSGTLRNNTDVTLREVLVMVGSESWGGDDLASGEEIDWEVKAPDDMVGVFAEGPLEQPWNDASGWNGPPDGDSPVNFALWSEFTARLVDPYPTGMAVAAGWTRDWVPPIDSSGSIDVGRTAFTTSAPVQLGEGGVAPAAAVRRDYLRGSQVTPVDDAQFGDIDEQLNEQWGVGLQASVMQFTLPAGSDPTAALEARLSGATIAAEAWDGDGWVLLERQDQEGNALPAEVPSPEEFDPSVSETTAVAPIPPFAVHDGVVMLRVVSADGMGTISTVTVGQVAQS